MWMSATLPVPAGLLRMGYNELTIEVGRAIPDCQAPGNAWDELLFRHVRLVREDGAASRALASMPLLHTQGEQVVKSDHSVTITVVFDNNTLRPGLATAWGFSTVVQHGGRTVLFDTGGDGQMLLANMAALGFTPRDLDVIVLSHDHADHTGGLEAVLEQNAQVTVYLPQAFRSGFKERVRALGAQVTEVTGPLEIAPGLWSTGHMGGSIIEQGLVLQTGDDLVVITGCAHPGIVEMVRKASEVGQADVSLVMGGFHLSGASTATMQGVVSGLDELGVARVAPCHCTGPDATRLFAAVFGERYQRCGVGLVLQQDE